MKQKRKRRLKWHRLFMVCILFAGAVFGGFYAYEIYLPKVLAYVNPQPASISDLPENVQGYFHDMKVLYPDAEEVDHMMRNYQAYPELLLKLAAKNPDAFSFVYRYPVRKNKVDETAQISSLDFIPTLYQWDERWGYASYGDGIIGTHGCATTAYSMILSYLTQDSSLTPLAISRYSDEHGYFLPEAGTSWQLFYDMSVAYGITCSDIALQEQAIRSALWLGHPVLASMKPGDFTTTGHLIVLVGFDEAGNLIVRDPNSETRTNQTWNLAEVVPQMAAAWEFT